MDFFCFGTIFVAVLIVAFVQISKARRGVVELQQELVQMRAALNVLERELQKRPRKEEPLEAAPPPAPAPPVPEPEPVVVAPRLETPPWAPPEPPKPRIPPPPITPPPPVTPPLPPAPPAKPFDWESLIGVKLFSWIAGVALVLAAVFFLKYSVEHGWLSPTVRATLGILTGVTLLIVCELRVARNYAVTANALDGAGIAILYSTLFAMHALWHLLPSGVVFFLMLIVTAVAVMLSIRRDSVFIALLGLMGGFATPALISTGENRPIGLFSYLLLLNLGLAWVAFRKGWPVLAFGSLIFTVLYQWAWIAKFLTASQLPLAALIFAVFAIAGSSALWTRSARGEGGSRLRFDKIALVSALMPLAFAIFGAAVPAYGARYNVLFTFLLFMTAGLAAIALWRGPQWLHSLGAVATLLTFAIWFGVSYRSQAWPVILGWIALFVIGYLAVATKLDSPASFAPALLLFAFPVLAIREPATASPALLFTSLFVLLALVAAFALWRSRGAIYFVAAFFAIVTEGIWSAKHLTSERLLPALIIYGAFALLFLAVPSIARRLGRALQPDWGVGATVILSLCVLLFLTGDGIAAGALWGLALLLAILIGGTYIEAAASTRPYLAAVCVVLAWIVLASWWEAAPLSTSLIPALVVIAVFGAMVLLASIWAGRVTDSAEFGFGAHLALIGHLFLMFVAGNSDLAFPPWPLFAVLLVLDLAVATAALYLQRATLVTGAVVLSQIVLMIWAGNARVAPWPNVALAATLLVATYAIAWYVLAQKRFGSSMRDQFGQAAISALFLGHVVAIIAGQSSATPLFGALLATHAVLLLAILTLAWTSEAHALAIFAVPLAAIATALARTETPLRELTFAGVFYAFFVAYPLLLGRRAGRSLHPYLAAVIAGVPFFFFARHAMRTAELDSIIGILPVGQAVLMIALIIRLLRIEPLGQRELGRLALVSAAALAFITVAVPLQLEKQWITIGWALEGAALVWLYTKIAHRGLLAWSALLLSIVFARLVFNPAVFSYHPASHAAIFNWYLYTYLVSAAAFFVAAYFWPRDVRPGVAASSAAGTVLLFFLLNIEIADFYSTGPTLTFNFFSSSLAQDLTYTIGWAIFAVGMLVAGILLRSKPARVAAIVLLAATILKCFLHDLGRLGGLYRVASLLGLALSLVAVGVLLQKFVMSKAAQAEETV